MLSALALGALLVESVASALLSVVVMLSVLCLFVGKSALLSMTRVPMRRSVCLPDGKGRQPQEFDHTCIILNKFALI